MKKEIAQHILEIVGEIQEATSWLEYFATKQGDDCAEWLERRDAAWDALYKILATEEVSNETRNQEQ